MWLETDSNGLEGVIGGVEPEIDLALDGQFDDRILEWMGNHYRH